MVSAVAPVKLDGRLKRHHARHAGEEEPEKCSGNPRDAHRSHASQHD